MVTDTNYKCNLSKVATFFCVVEKNIRSTLSIVQTFKMRLKKRVVRLQNQLNIELSRKIAFNAGSLLFQCNICSAKCSEPLSQISRERPSCQGCGSTLRLRTLMFVITQRILGLAICIDQAPVRKDIFGVGMSDSTIFAEKLSDKFSYTNTFYHCEPKLDIMNPPPNMISKLDFVITSDVLEHVLPPVSLAFENIFKILKPGGVLLLTVPYTRDEDSIEHFPNLHDFKVIEGVNGFYLENMTIDGKLELFNNLCFHGGPGSTLEMRVFCEKEVLRLLKNTGFIDICIHKEPYFDFGIYQPESWSLPISAKKPNLI